MARPKELLRSCRVEPAKHTRKCRGGKGHVIPGGCRCLVFHENMREKSYCQDCARRILERGRKRVDELLAELAVEDLVMEEVK